MQKIIRKTELDKLLVLKDKNLIKVITGVRRAGKSRTFKKGIINRFRKRA